MNDRSGRWPPLRRNGMWRLPSWCAATILVASCGGASSTTVTTNATDLPDPTGFTAADARDAQRELEQLIDGDDDLRVVWRGVGFLPPDVIPADDVASTAAVVWIEDYDEVLRLDSVTEVVDCDDACVGDATTWAEAQLAVGPVTTIVGERICGNCVEAYRLSFVTEDADGEFVTIDTEALGTMIGDIDTAYEVMLTFNRSVRIRSDGAGWRAIDEREISDCDPVITEYTMYSVNAAGDREQLAQLETSDNACA